MPRFKSLFQNEEWKPLRTRKLWKNGPHIQAVYDLQAENTTEHFRFAISECRKVIARLVGDDNSSDQQIARVNVLRYLDLQLSRAVEWAAAEADLLAVVLRAPSS